MPRKRKLDKLACGVATNDGRTCEVKREEFAKACWLHLLLRGDDLEIPKVDEWWKIKR